MSEMKFNLKSMPDEELHSLYHDVLINHVLGDESELMYELGYDIRDIVEYEKTKREWSKFLRRIEKELNSRGIDPWGDE